MKTHTPGPWYLKHEHPASVYAGLTYPGLNWPNSGTISTARGDVYVQLGYGRGDDECEANLRLIASAPALLAALEDCVTEPGAMAWNDGETAYRRLRAINESARSALSLARGSNPSPTIDPRDAEIARLREALKLALEWSDDGSPDSERGALELEFRDAARAALAGGGAR